MKKNTIIKTITAYTVLLINLSIFGAAPTNDPLTLAKSAISEFTTNKTISHKDKLNFAQYLTYYRSEGHYQAVTPAPRELRESLAQEAKDLFSKILNLAKDFEIPKKNIPGSSSLSKDGEKFFESIISFTSDRLNNSKFTN